MENDSKNSFCPICYKDYSEAFFLCCFELCLHEICFDCFNLLKIHSDKCPICGIFYKNILKKDIFKDNEIIEIYELSEDDLDKIKKNKANILENYDCFDPVDIKKELQEYLSIVNGLNNKLFYLRCSDGSDKEYEIIQEVYDRIGFSKTLLDNKTFDSKILVENLDFIVHSIKNIRDRKFVKL